MKGKWTMVGVMGVLLLLALGVSLTQAQGARPQVETAAPASPGIAAATPLSTTFTYQGQLKQNGAPVNGACDLQIGLYDDATLGSQVGLTQTRAISVTNGLFTTSLDFGVGAFNGEARWLAVVVRCPATSGTWAALTPRQPLTPSPYALALPGLWAQPNATSPNLIGGYSGNWISNTVVGAAIGGGGQSGSLNRVAADFGTIGGGLGNTISGTRSTIAGGYLNTVSFPDSTIGGGWGNVASDWHTTVGGGLANTASGNKATIGGGHNNVAQGFLATISGGYSNTITSDDATIGGGIENTVTGYRATIGGGYQNRAGQDYATIGGGRNNTAAFTSTTVGGGWYNQASNIDATVGGGFGNTASGQDSTIGGGWGNVASDWQATVGGGLANTASGNKATIGGGHNNVAQGFLATISGGYSNTITSNDATIGGGIENTVTGYRATIGGGYSNTVSTSGDYATIGGGRHNSAVLTSTTVGGGFDNQASGYAATIPGGLSNTASGNYSLAAGRQANANHDGAFVWADSGASDFASERADQFRVRAMGGARFDVNGGWVNIYNDATNVISTSTGARLTIGGAWTNNSDRNAKASLAPVNGQAVLARLAGVSITTWNYKAEDPAIRHMGPMAQDFYATFGLGGDDRSISTVDADGVTMAAIQGLYQLEQEKDAKIAAQQKEIDALKQQNANMEARLAALEARGNGGALGNVPVTWLLATAGGLFALGAVVVQRERKRAGGER